MPMVFIFLAWSFPEQRFFNFDKVQFIHYSFCDFDVNYKNFLSNPKPQRFSSIFKRVLYFYILSPWDIFELMFALCVRFRSLFVFLFACGCPIPSAPFVKNITFPLLNYFCTLVINQLEIEVNGNGGIKTSKSPLPHKSNKKTGQKKKIIKVNFFITVEIN